MRLWLWSILTSSQGQISCLKGPCHWSDYLTGYPIVYFDKEALKLVWVQSVKPTHEHKPIPVANIALVLTVPGELWVPELSSWCVGPLTVGSLAWWPKMQRKLIFSTAQNGFTNPLVYREDCGAAWSQVVKFQSITHTSPLWVGWMVCFTTKLS